MKKFNFLFLIACLSFTFFSCSDDTDVENEEELITTLTYTLTPKSGGSPVIFSFKDLDGDGGSQPVIVNGRLKANTTYDGVIKILNESESPAEDITKEVIAEADEHQLFYATTGATVSYADTDSKNLPLGVKTTLATKTAGSSSLKITLLHEPNKSAQGVKDGIITNAGGETDIEVNFTMTIEN
jgi:hypothetical protein